MRATYELSPTFGLCDARGEPLTPESQRYGLAGRWDRLPELEQQEAAVDFVATVILCVVGDTPATLQADVADPDDRRDIGVLVDEVPLSGVQCTRAFVTGPVSPMRLRAILSSNQVVVDVFVDGATVAHVHDSVADAPTLLWLTPVELERALARIAATT